MNGHKFLDLFRLSQFTHIGVAFAVVSKIVPCFIDLYYLFRKFFHPLAGHEKSSFYIVGGKDIQDGLCVFISPCGIKADRDLRLICFYTVDGQFAAAGSAGYRYQTGAADETA